MLAHYLTHIDDSSEDAFLLDPGEDLITGLVRLVTTGGSSTSVGQVRLSRTGRH